MMDHPLSQWRDPVFQFARFAELKPQLDALLKKLEESSLKDTKALLAKIKDLKLEIAELRMPKTGQLVMCFYEKHETFWVGAWHANIACTRWKPA